MKSNDDNKGQGKGRKSQPQQPRKSPKPPRRPNNKGSVTRDVAERNVITADGRFPMTPQEMRRDYIKRGVIRPQPSRAWD